MRKSLDTRSLRGALFLVIIFWSAWHAAGQSTSTEQFVPAPPLPFDTPFYLHSPLEEIPPPPATFRRFRPATLGDVAAAPALDPNAWQNCWLQGTPEPDAAMKANIVRANEWSAAASLRAQQLGFGQGRYAQLRCRGDIIADWLADGGLDPLSWLFRVEGFDSPLGKCLFRVTFDRTELQRNWTPIASVTFNGKRYALTLQDPLCTAGCVGTHFGPCESEREPTRLTFESAPVTKALRDPVGRYVNEFSFRLNDGNVKRHTLDRLDSLLWAAVGPAALDKVLSYRPKDKAQKLRKKRRRQ